MKNHLNYMYMELTLFVNKIQVIQNIHLVLKTQPIRKLDLMFYYERLIKIISTTIIIPKKFVIVNSKSYIQIIMIL